MSGFHVDPGYQGKLIFSVFNAGPSAIQVKRFDELFQLWFADIDISDNRTPASSLDFVRPFKVVNEHLPSEIISNVSDRLVSLQDMSKQIEDLDKKVSKIYLYAAAFGVVVLLFLNLGRIAKLLEDWGINVGS